jgi:hypothetical protein
MTSRAVQSCPRACVSLCTEIAKLKQWQTEGKMASEVYKPMGERKVPGYTEVTDPAELSKLGLNSQMLQPGDSEFRAGVFRKDGTGEYSVVFKGTTSKADWLQNLSQGATGYADYYKRATEIGKRAASGIGYEGVNSVKFVGHSLGGGLASAASHATGLPATTFNAAGLHLFNRNIFNPPPIDAVRVRGEILTTVQSAIPLAPAAVGSVYRLDPPPNVASSLSRAGLNWKDALLPIKGATKYAKAAVNRAIDLHLMTAVNPALDQQLARRVREARARNCAC